MVRIPSLNEPNSARPGSGWDGVDYLDSVKKATDDYDAAAPIRAEIAELKKKNEDLKESLLTDEFGFLNAKFLEKYADESFHAERDHNKIAVVFADMNGLRAINNNYSHNIGDQMLKATGDFLKANFNEEDILIHLHISDEFIIICRNINPDDTTFEEKMEARLAEILRLASQTMVQIVDANGNPIEGLCLPLSISAGVKVFDKNLDDNLFSTGARAEEDMKKGKSWYKEA